MKQVIIESGNPHVRANPAPAISVVIPIYNVQDYLPRALDSLLAQTFTDFEVICVNDGSPDDSLSILEAYAAKDSRVKIISRKNSGVSATRNRGFDAARGDYIYCLDPDDLIHPKTFEIAYAAVTKEDADFVCFHYHRFDESYTFETESADETDNFFSQNPFRDWYTVMNLKYGFMPTVWRFLFRRSAIGSLRFDTTMRDNEDVLFLSLFLLQCTTGAFIKNKLYYYYHRPGSLSRAKMADRRLKYAEKVCAETFLASTTPDQRRVCRKYLVPQQVKALHKLLKIQQKTGEISLEEMRVGHVEWGRCVTALLQKKALYLPAFSFRWQIRILYGVLKTMLKG